MTLALSVIETLKGSKVVALAAVNGRHKKLVKRTVLIGTVTVVVPAGRRKSAVIGLNRAGKRLLDVRHLLPARFTITQSGKILSTSTITFRAKRNRIHRP